MSKSTPRLPKELKALRDHFTRWRGHRPSPRQAIPHELLVAACRLTKDYGTKLVLTTLGLNYTQLKRGKGAVKVGSNKEDNNVSEANRFVEVLPAQLFTTSGSIEIIKADGMCLKLSGVDGCAIHEVVKCFMGDR